MRDIRYIIADNVRLCRKQRNLTQLELAERADLSVDSIKRIESGISTMSLDNFLRLLDILLFVPLGIFLPVIWSQDLFTLKRTVVFGLGLSFLIEVSQLFTFRLTDIDDIITNVLGTALGYYLLLYCKKHCNIKTDIVDGKISARVELFVLFFYTTLIMFFVKPYIR